MGTVSVPNSTLVSFQGLQMGVFVFRTERDWSQKSCYGNTIEGIILFEPKNGKILNKRYLWKCESNVLETWHHKCASQKKHKDTLNVVTMATVWPLVLS